MVYKIMKRKGEKNYTIGWEEKFDSNGNLNEAPYSLIGTDYPFEQKDFTEIYDLTEENMKKYKPNG